MRWSITTAHLRAFIAERQEAGASAAEINRELAVLRRAFNLAVQAGRLIHRPHFPMLKERNVRRGFLEAAQVDAICAALPESLRPVVRDGISSGSVCADDASQRTATAIAPETDWSRNQFNAASRL